MSKKIISASFILFNYDVLGKRGKMWYKNHFSPYFIQYF